MRHPLSFFVCGIPKSGRSLVLRKMPGLYPEFRSFNQKYELAKYLGIKGDYEALKKRPYSEVSQALHMMTVSLLRNCRDRPFVMEGEILQLVCGTTRHVSVAPWIYQFDVLVYLNTEPAEAYRLLNPFAALSMFGAMPDDRRFKRFEAFSKEYGARFDQIAQGHIHARQGGHQVEIVSNGDAIEILRQLSMFYEHHR